MTVGMKRHPTPLETVFVEVPEPALDAYEAAFSATCATTAFFLADEDARTWRIEGVRTAADPDDALHQALALAALATGVAAPLARVPTEAEGWLARTEASFPPQPIGARFLVRGTHETTPPYPGRIVLTLDAGLAFGSGEHGSTRGCLRALERVARTRRPRTAIDLGTGSGILAMAAARLLRRTLARPVLATDIEPWSVRVARQNAALNRLTARIHPIRADGWHDPRIRHAGPYDLVFANILARPLCRMAARLAANLAPGGTAILAGLLANQARSVIAAHRHSGLILETTLHEGNWTTLVLRRPKRRPTTTARPRPAQLEPDVA